MVEAHNNYESSNQKYFFNTYPPTKIRFTFFQNPDLIMIFLNKTNFKPHLVLICYRIIVYLVIRILSFNYRCRNSSVYGLFVRKSAPGVPP